jgi:hypothetical protein
VSYAARIPTTPAEHHITADRHSPRPREIRHSVRVDEHPRSGIELVYWPTAVSSLIDHGYTRLEGLVDASACTLLAASAPASWEQLPEVEGEVHQAGLRAWVAFDAAAPVVQEFGRTICDSLTAVHSDVPAVPCFNEVQWGRSYGGVGFITAHRDPPAAGGVIAIVTLRGRAVFRVWHGSQAAEWETTDGDLVLLRGQGWPQPDAICPVHEVESSRGQDRMTMTLRHNTRGPGGGYFA